MLISVNKSLVNKYEPDDEYLKKNFNKFEKMDISVSELAALIKQGYAFCAQYKNWKKSANFQAAGFLAVDVDKGLTIEDVKNHPFFQKYAAFLYTTSSHTPAAHRFRIVFELEVPINDMQTMADAYTGLIAQFGSDGQCSDACRMFFGSTKAEIIIQDRKLPASIVEQLVTRVQESTVRSDDSSPGSLDASTRFPQFQIQWQHSLLIGQPLPALGQSH